MRERIIIYIYATAIFRNRDNNCNREKTIFPSALFSRRNLNLYASLSHCIFSQLRKSLFFPSKDIEEFSLISVRLRKNISSRPSDSREEFSPKSKLTTEDLTRCCSRLHEDILSKRYGSRVVLPEKREQRSGREDGETKYRAAGCESFVWHCGARGLPFSLS